MRRSWRSRSREIRISGATRMFRAADARKGMANPARVSALDGRTWAADKSRLVTLGFRRRLRLHFLHAAPDGPITERGMIVTPWWREPRRAREAPSGASNRQAAEAMARGRRAWDRGVRPPIGARGCARGPGRLPPKREAPTSRSHPPSIELRRQTPLAPRNQRNTDHRAESAEAQKSFAEARGKRPPTGLKRRKASLESCLLRAKGIILRPERPQTLH